MSAPAYLKFFGRDLFIFTAGLKKSEKAAIFDGIIHLNMYGFWPENIKILCEKSENFAKNFEKIEELFAKSLKNYQKTCERNSQNAKVKSLKNKDISNPLATHSFNKNTETETEEETETDINKQHTAPKVAGSAQQKPKQLNDLQKFAKAVAERFEEPMDKVQLGIWYKRNCRCLTDILNFCGKNIPLGLETISVCVRRLEKAGLSGGYEAVARNLPEYLAQAKKQMEVLNAGN